MRKQSGLSTNVLNFCSFSEALYNEPAMEREKCAASCITFITTFKLGINSLLIQILNARKLTISISLLDSVHAILAVQELKSMIFESISQRRTPKAQSLTFLTQQSGHLHYY